MTAEKNPMEMLANLVRESFVREPLRLALPVSTSGCAVSFVHQAKILPVFNRREFDLVIECELHAFEEDRKQLPVEGLDTLFGGYANESRFNYGKRFGDITFVQRNGDAWWPKRYKLLPLLGPEHADDPSKAERRIAFVAERLDPHPPKIRLLWSKIKAALERGDRVDDAREFQGYASLYQATGPTEARTLWVAALPRLRDKQTPDAKNRVKLDPNQGGVLVELAPMLVANLLYLMGEAGVAADAIAFARAYYVRQPTETPERLEREIDRLERELADTRARLRALYPASATTPSDEEE